MDDFYGGGIPFSAMLDKKDKKDKKYKKRRNSRLTKRRKRSRTKVKNSKKSLKLNNLNKCKCSLDKNSPSPEGLGFCALCSPLNIMMKGKNGKLWEIVSSKKTASKSDLSKYWKQIN